MSLGVGNSISLDQFVDLPQDQWPTWLNDLIYEIAFKRIPLREVQAHYHLSRKSIDDFLTTPKIEDIIKSLRAEAYKRLSENLNALQFQALEVLEQCLADGKQDNKLKAALEVLRGLGRLKDHSDIEGRVQVVIEKELSQDNK